MSLLGWRLCRCGHRRDRHDRTWGWTVCETPGCSCPQFRWVRLGWYWDWRYRRSQRG